MTDKKSDNAANMAERVNQRDQFQTDIADAAKTFVPLVKAIEAETPTSQDHYAEYMMLISKLVSDIGADDHSDAPADVKAKFVGLVLLEAGANVTGVKGAITALGYRT